MPVGKGSHPHKVLFYSLVSHPSVFPSCYLTWPLNASEGRCRPLWGWLRHAFSIYFRFCSISKHDIYDLTEGGVETDMFPCQRKQRLEENKDPER